MIYTQICEHNKVTIQAGKQTGLCKVCSAPIMFQNGFSERKRFNKTLMREFNSYHEGEKWAKKKGLACIGNEPLENVFKPEKHDFKPILEDGIKRIRAMERKR